MCHSQGSMPQASVLASCRRVHGRTTFDLARLFCPFTCLPIRIRYLRARPVVLFGTCLYFFFSLVSYSICLFELQDLDFWHAFRLPFRGFYSVGSRSWGFLNVQRQRSTLIVGADCVFLQVYSPLGCCNLWNRPRLSLHQLSIHRPVNSLNAYALFCVETT
ncbi:hypothetical protein EDD85DRAFT_246967 [Armillaria nabsnona]|nr:hypothetical protein EDD85DRAFT_246967 [Armillaria nabsnona]